MVLSQVKTQAHGLYLTPGITISGTENAGKMKYMMGTCAAIKSLFALFGSTTLLQTVF
jgi:hypothetical protein